MMVQGYRAKSQNSQNLYKLNNDLKFSAEKELTRSSKADGKQALISHLLR